VTPTEILTECFAALPAVNRARLLRHAKRGTPICCGERYYFWRRGKGG
jgi:hypothetical protein